jgi:glutathione synthase/RimK-type ligase-like ATP-grasp enzyme
LDQVAHHKPYQLAVAREVGLPIPRTLVTNDPRDARAFIDALGVGHVVYKAFVATEAHWRETRVLREHELADLQRVRLAPVIFQELVSTAMDVRVTVVGDRIFATRITVPPDGYQFDYRMELDRAAFDECALPEDTCDKIRHLMRRLGLLYGAIDLRRTREGEYLFLEINPSGEWRFVEERSGQPITHAMAGFLAWLDR